MKRAGWVVVVSCCGWAIAQAEEAVGRSTLAGGPMPAVTVSAQKSAGDQPTSGALPELGRKLAAQPVRIPAGVHVRPLGASRTYVNYIYDNAPGATDYWPGTLGLPFETCVQPIPGQNLVSCFYVEMIATTVPVNVTMELAPAEGQPAYAGTAQTFTITTAGRWGITADLATPVDISADIAKGYIVVRQTYDQLDAGPLMGEEAECGVSPNNWYYWQGTYYWFGGDPFAAFSAQLFGPEQTPFPGACCDMGVCFETDDYYTCQYVHSGKWFCFQTCPEFTACPHVGACCKGGVCIGTMYEADCTSQGGHWFVDENCDTYVCPPRPPNDNCGDAIPVTIPADSSYTWTGDNTYATEDCSVLDWPAEVWFVFTTTETLNVKVDLCGTTPAFATFGIAVVPDCPCSTWNEGSYGDFNCYDGNGEIYFNNLPAGTWYCAMYTAPGSEGQYTLTITTTTPPPPPPNDNCGDVTPFALAPGSPVTITGDNTGATSDCVALGWPGDVWFAFTTTESLDVTVDLCGTTPPFGTAGIVLVPDCPCSTYLFYGVSYDFSSCDGNITMHFYNVEAGTHYYPMYSLPGIALGPYTINFTAALPCTVECPPGSTPEAEICGELYPNGTNGGCNSTPAAFEAITCGETLCGTLWADSSYRDTDWFQLTTTVSKTFRWTATGEGPLLIFVMDGTDGCDSYSVIASAVAAPCQPATIETSVLPPGTYWFWAGLSTWGDYPCDQIYYATLTCTSSPCSPCFGGAQTCDEYISQVDFGAMSNPTGCGLGSNGVPGYSDYTATVIDLTVGHTYTLTVNNGNPVWSADTCGAWIDWTGDFCFEFYNMGIGVGPYSTAITVPNAPGHHRLRIRIDYASAPNPCGISTYGEVEDYTVNVVAVHPTGDVNWDGYVNAFDIDPFVQCLVSGTPTPPATDCSNADVNGDGSVNAFDIDPFVDLLTGK